MGGVSRRSFTSLRNLCGDETLTNVVIVTNMWGLVQPEDGEAREAELKTNPHFFQVALERGAQFYRHDNTTSSAEQIIRSIIKNYPRELRVQHEMVTLQRALSDTTVGLQVKGELDIYVASLQNEVETLRKERAQDKAAMSDLKAAVEEARATIAQVKKQMIVLLGVERAWHNMPADEKVAMMFRLSAEGNTGRNAFWDMLGGPVTIESISCQLQREFSRYPIPLEIREQLLHPDPEDDLVPPQTNKLLPQLNLWIGRNAVAVGNMEKVVRKHFSAKKRSRWPRWGNTRHE